MISKNCFNIVLMLKRAACLILVVVLNQAPFLKKLNSLCIAHIINSNALALSLLFYRLSQITVVIAKNLQVHQTFNCSVGEY